MSTTQRRVLTVVTTDTTFAVEVVRGERVWVGKCFYCNTKLVVGLDGTIRSHASVEHIRARSHGGDDDPHNLALACTSCNGAKGRGHDKQRRPGEVLLAQLAEKRVARWRDGVV